MIQALSAITYIENEFKKLKASGNLNGKIHRSATSVSLYVNTKRPDPNPQKSIRSSNHHPNMKNMLAGNRAPWNTTNISIEFYEPIIGKNGKVVQNRFNSNVFQNQQGTIQPFTVTVYQYVAKKLDWADIPIIFKAIVDFITNNVYNDPFRGTSKAAHTIEKTAKIKQRKQKQKNVSKSVSSPASFTQTSTSASNFTTPTITEDQLRQIIRESIEEVMLNEGKLGKAIGAAALGAGLMFGHPQAANAQLRDVQVHRVEPKVPSVPSGKISSTLYVNFNLNDCTSLQYKAGNTWGFFYLDANSHGDAIQTLLDLKKLIESHTEEIVVRDYANTKFNISFDDGRNALKIIEELDAIFDREPFYLTIKDIDKAIQEIQARDEWWKEYVLNKRKVKIDEGKLGKALGAAALGAGLMFGAPQDAKAQLNTKQEVQSAIPSKNVFSRSTNEWEIEEYVERNVDEKVGKYGTELSIVLNTTLTAKELFLNAKENFYENPTFKYYIRDDGNYEIAVAGKNNEWRIRILIKENKFKIIYNSNIGGDEWNEYKWALRKWFCSVCADIITTDSNSAFNFEEE